MNKGIINNYIDKNGKIHTRTLIKRYRMIIFASIKIIFDELFSFLGLVLLLPLELIIALAIKLDSKGPVLFKQKRTGKHGKEFTLYKFRSMRVDNDVHNFTEEDKHTKVGKILRKTSLDEIPQLINILKHDMSFIGPRPWIIDYYKKMNKVQKHRYQVRPGITGLAQCSGRNTLTINDKINCDLEYVKYYSLGQDIKIIFLTIKQVIFGKGTDAGKETIKKELEDLDKTSTLFLEDLK